MLCNKIFSLSPATFCRLGRVESVATLGEFLNILTMKLVKSDLTYFMMLFTNQEIMYQKVCILA